MIMTDRAREVEFSEAEGAKIKKAVDEACFNALEYVFTHGKYGSWQHRELEMRQGIRAEGNEWLLKSRTSANDLTAIATKLFCLRTPPKASVSGWRGLHILRHFTHEFQYLPDSPTRNSQSLVKNLKKSGALGIVKGRL